MPVSVFFLSPRRQWFAAISSANQSNDEKGLLEWLSRFARLENVTNPTFNNEWVSCVKICQGIIPKTHLWLSAIERSASSAFLAQTTKALGWRVPGSATNVESNRNVRKREKGAYNSVFDSPKGCPQINTINLADLMGSFFFLGFLAKHLASYHWQNASLDQHNSGFRSCFRSCYSRKTVSYKKCIFFLFSPKRRNPLDFLQPLFCF